MTGEHAARIAAFLARAAVRIALFVPWAILTGWCVLAIAWAPQGPGPWTWSVAAGFGILCVAAAAGPLPPIARARPSRWVILGALWAAVIAWFWFLPAPADDRWLPDVREMPTFTVHGTEVTVSGIRNFRYGTSDTDFQEVWVERRYDLQRLRTADLFFSFWGPELICHNFVTFGFEKPDGGMDYLAVSIEARKRVGQEYSAVGGLFRQFTLCYVWADERDVVRVRTNFRGEHVHRWRVEASPENARILFERYMIDTTELHAHPRWYNAVTQSCGIDILRTAWGQAIPLIPSPRLLLNGTWERQAWEAGRIEPALPFDDAIRMADITEDARTAGIREFSQAIRRRDPLLRMQPPTR